MDLVEGNFTPVDFKSAAAKPDPSHAAFDHEIQLVSYQLLMEAATGESPPSLDLVFLVKTKTPQVIRVSSPPADEHRKRRVIALLETAVEGIASSPACSARGVSTKTNAWPGSPASGSPPNGPPEGRPAARRAAIHRSPGLRLARGPGQTRALGSPQFTPTPRASQPTP